MLNKLVCGDVWYCLWFHFSWFISFPKKQAITSSGHRTLLDVLSLLHPDLCRNKYIQLRQSPYLANAMAFIVLIDAFCTCTSERSVRGGCPSYQFKKRSDMILTTHWTLWQLFCSTTSRWQLWDGSWSTSSQDCTRAYLLNYRGWWWMCFKCFKMAKLYQLCVKQTEWHTN